MLATLGLALLTSGQILGLGSGDLLVLVGALCFACHIVTVGIAAPRADPLALTIVQLTVVAALQRGHLARHRTVDSPHGFHLGSGRLYRGACYGGSVWSPDVDATLYDSGPHGADLYRRAGLCRTVSACSLTTTCSRLEWPWGAR